MIEDEINFGWKSLGENGIWFSYETILVDPIISGNILIGNKTCLDKYKTVYLGKSWKEVLINLQNSLIKTYLRIANIKFSIDLDDYDMCADGFMWFNAKNIEETNKSISTDVFGTFVTFSRIEHEYISKAISTGKSKWKSTIYQNEKL